jgi:ABC-type multidrug transport system fused ATPase/permease subunit
LRVKLLLGRRGREATGTTPGDAPSGKSTRTTLRVLFEGHEAAIGGVAVTSVLSGLTEAGILAAVAQAAAALLSDTGRVHTEVGPLNIDMTVGALLGFACALVVARMALQGLLAFLQARVGSQVQAGLRNDLYASFSRASWTEKSNDTEGHLQEMLTSQAIQATWGTQQIATLISAFFTFAALIVSAMLLNFVAAAVVVGVAVAVTGLLRPLSALGQRRAKELSQAQMEFANGVGEAVRMEEENQVFGVGDVQLAGLKTRIARAQGLVFRTGLVNRLVPNLYQGLLYLTVVIGLWVLSATGAGSVASLGAVVLLLVRAGNYGQQLQGAYQLARQSLPFAERIKVATERYSSSHPGSGSRGLISVDTVSFIDVSFAYRPGQPVLSDISFEIHRGETVGIIGPSGAGKSTLVQLLLQLRRPDSGIYSINGIPATQFAPGDWHRRIGYVPQEPRLLHATVADNIRFYRDIDDAMVEKAAKLARIHEEILTWDDGYQTIIGPLADSVSGGQQQRISVARALAASPSLLILDEPTSSLDPRSESLIQASLTELSEELTLFIVTHKMSTLTICDRVMVIVDNRVDGFDEPHVLEKTNAYFGGAAALSVGATVEGP